MIFDKFLVVFSKNDKIKCILIKKFYCFEYFIVKLLYYNIVLLMKIN